MARADIPTPIEIATIVARNPYKPEAQKLKAMGQLPRDIARWRQWFQEIPTSLREDPIPRLALCVGIARAPGMTENETRYRAEVQGEQIPEHEKELAFRAVRVERKLDLIAGISTSMNDVRLRTWAAAFGEGLEDVKGLKGLVASTPVLIHGPTGTGKELIAKALMLSAPSRTEHGTWKPAKAESVHLASITSTLVQDDLFGHVKGAFTGAERNREGVLERCHGGVVFLDEVAELPSETQVSLLRVLQEGKVRRLGSPEEVDAAPRIISATHQDLAARVREGKFRRDLYYRLCSVIIHTTALRERPEDIDILAEKEIEKVDTSLRATLMEKFNRFRAERPDYEWPGNVRELQAVIHGLALGLAPEFQPFDDERSSDANMQELREGKLSLNQAKTWYAKRVRERFDTDAAAAERLGIHRGTLSKLLKEPTRAV